jgi:hypothetical protein
MTPNQLELFAATDPDALQPTPGGLLGRGARGLLKALVQRGLAEDAFEVAAALCLLLDEGANGHS